MDSPHLRMDHSTVSLHGSGTGHRADEPGCLLVIQGTQSTLCPLPTAGVMVLGRAKDAGLQLGHSSVSRYHARLFFDHGELLIEDLGSHNGTRVNRELLTAPRPLAFGDVIALGDVSVVVTTGTGVGKGRSQRCAIVELAQLRQYLEEELDRAERTGRRVAVLCLDLAQTETPPEREPLAMLIAQCTRRIDRAAWCGPTALAIAAPELDERELREVTTRLLQATAAYRSRIGFSFGPSDGGEADALLHMARRAAMAALSGKASPAAAGVLRRQLGEHKLLLSDPAMLRLFELIDELAASELPVLVHGETGTGKELVAAALHHGSPRRGHRLVTINCAALPESIFESELFGHERGAFSGAVAAKPGLLETAEGGTVLLDEIGELSLVTQAKLLRVLETRRLTRVGDVRERAINVRLIAATNRDLMAESQAGRFRSDLYYRLSAASVHLPPLRQRPVEIPLLARTFLDSARERLGRAPLALSDTALTCLLSHRWPGNVRELRNLMEFLAATVKEAQVESWHLPLALAAATPGLPPSPGAAPGTRRFRPLAEELRELERTRLCEALEAAEGIQIRAADLLGMPHRTFFAKMRQHGLKPVDSSRRPSP